MIALDVLLQRIEHAGLVLGRYGSFDNKRIDHLANDSRKVGHNGLYVAISGVHADGHAFIDKAVQNGAIAVVCEAMPVNHETRFTGIAFAHVSNSRAALAELGAAFYDDPSHSMTTIGVTGTNGKTTVTYLLHHALSQIGHKTGLIGTIEVRIGDDVLETSLTTPDALETQKLFRQMVDAGCSACAMEVSSHALDQDRARCIDFDVGVFTNLSRDHLDYHGTFGAYLTAKKKLFDQLRGDAVAVYNIDDSAAEELVADTKAARISFGLTGDALVRAELIANRIDGLRLRLDGEHRQFRLVGRFNAYNLAAAYAVLNGLGFDRTAALDALEHAPPVPGRFELIRSDDGRFAVVDYAHTPDALENVLQTAAETKDRGARIICVFGCGGDRDREKRPMMAAAAERLADQVIVTSDNPRTEDPGEIMADIRRGFERPANVEWIVDRRQAIRKAATIARSGDVIIVAGKGHEAYQIIGTEKRHLDDREVVREAFHQTSTGDIQET